MNRRIRHILSLLFFLAFLVITPALIISTAGYRYNFLKGRIERTGVLFVSSKPSGAEIILNGGNTEKKTPNRIRRLLPGTYNVSLKREGYHTWNKTIEISSRETTFLNNVILFRDETPEVILNLPVEATVFSPNRRYVIVRTETTSHTEFRVINLRSGKTYLPYRVENVAGASLDVVWSPDSTRFFLSRRSGNLPVFFLWNAEEPEKITNLIDISPALYESAFWSQTGRFLYAVSDGKLFSVDIESRTTTEIGPSAEAMRVIDSSVFGVFRDATGVTLVRRGLHDTTFNIIGTIPEGNYRELNGNNHWIALYDDSTSKLVLIDPSSRENGLTYHELRADEIDWSDDGLLLYRNGIELHVFDAKVATDRLVTRLGGNLGSARWYPENGLVIYSNGKDALLTEASNDTKRSITPIAHFTELKDFILDNKGSRAWFTGNIAGREGLWTLKLR